MAGEEVLNVCGVDSAGSAELVAGQLSSPNPIPDRPVADGQVGGEAALGEELRGGCFSGHTF
jgi:hypothetical protein